jgi:hypothetical protein
MPFKNFINLMAYNQSVPQLWALNSGRISVSINGSVDLSTLSWCPTCAVCYEYVIMVDSFYLGRTTEVNSVPTCLCAGSLLESDLINLINRIASKVSQGPFANISAAMTFALNEGMFVTNQSYPYIPTLNNELFLDAGLPASYPLSGNLWIDMTGNQNNGTLVNGVTHDLNLKGSLVFNGTNQYVTFSSPVDIPVANSNYTINAWFNTDTLANRGIIGWGDYSTTNQSNYIKLTNTGISNSWTNNDLSFNTVIPTGQWQNVIAKYDGTTRELWLNGVMVAQDTPVGHNVTNANNLTIGLTNTNEYFDGKLSLVQVFNRALTSEEIQDSFLNFKTRYDGTDTEICITPVYCTPSPTRTPTQTPTQTKTQTQTPTQTPSQTPTSPKGECWSVTEQYGNYSYVSYIDRYGNQACETVGPYSTVTLCIFPNSENAIQGYEEPLCTGNGVDYYEQDLMSECYEFCAPPTPTPTGTPPSTPTPTPTKDCVGCGESKSGTYSGEDFYIYPPTYLCDLGVVTDICYTATDSVNPGGGEIDTNNGSYGTTTTTIYASNFNFNNTINYTTKYSALLVGDELKVTIGSTNYFFLVTSIVNNTTHQTIGVSLISATGPNQTPTFATTVCVYFESNETIESQISWAEIDRPNRFAIYNSVGQVANTGWVGFATYSGPWGDSLNNPGPGSLGFIYNPLFKPYYVVVDAGPADPSSPISDAYNFTVICSAPPQVTPTSTPIPVTPTPTPTNLKYTLTIYSSLEDIPNFPVGNYPVEQAARVYNTQGPNNVLLGGNIRSVSCNFLKTITNIVPGTIISLGMLGWSSNRPIEYDIFLGDLCSGTKLTFGCGTALDHGGGSSITVNSNMTISIVAKVSSKAGGGKSFTYCLPV